MIFKKKKNISIKKGVSDLFGIYLILFHVEGHRRHIEKKKIINILIIK